MQKKACRAVRQAVYCRLSGRICLKFGWAVTSPRWRDHRCLRQALGKLSSTVLLRVCPARWSFVPAALMATRSLPVVAQLKRYQSTSTTAWVCLEWWLWFGESLCAAAGFKVCSRRVTPRLRRVPVKFAMGQPRLLYPGLLAELACGCSKGSRRSRSN